MTARPLAQLVACAASPARHLHELIRGLQRQGWRVQVAATPSAQRWLDPDRIEATTGAPFAVTDMPGAELAEAGLLLVAPATFNTINAIAAGRADSVALLLIHEALGRGIPVVLAPHVNRALAASAILARSQQALQDLGVTVVEQAACEGGCGPEQHWPAVLAAAGSLIDVPEVVIRRERASDVGDTAAVHAAAWRQGHAGLLPAHLLEPDVEVWTRRRAAALQRDDGDVTLIAESGGCALGHVTVRRLPADITVGQVWSCYVDPQWWGAGVGDKLLTAALELLDDCDVVLWVLAGNQRAIAFYARHGFRVGEHSMFTPEPAVQVDQVQMVLRRESRRSART